MTFWKRLITIFAALIVSMLLIPLVAVHTVTADAGMAVTLLLFFVVYPVVSAWLGVLAGRDAKRFWYTPVLIAVLFWLFSSLTYETAFPIVYSVIYLVISALSMVITRLWNKKLQK